jgi:hypothetical protein
MKYKHIFYLKAVIFFNDTDILDQFCSRPESYNISIMYGEGCFLCNSRSVRPFAAEIFMRAREGVSPEYQRRWANHIKR